MAKCTFTSVLLMTIWISTSEASKIRFPPHLIGINSSVFTELEAYAEYKKVDLGFDSYDDQAPMHIRKAMADATLSPDVTLNQYDVPTGLPRFNKAVADFYSPLIGRKIIHTQEAFATIGATGGIYNAFVGHTSPGDEWIVIQPAYSMYVPIILSAHGVPKYTFLNPKKTSGKITSQDWELDRQHMESLFTKRTKGILLNNPLNPLGKVYTREEIEFIAGLAKKYDTIVVSDEAHEWLAFEEHTRIASLPGMWERTITVGSSSKSFILAGYRVGWAYGSADVLNNCKTIHERTSYAAPTPPQQALAIAFEQELRDFGKPTAFFAIHNREVKYKRDFLVTVFEEMGLKPILPSAGYCMSVDWTPFKNRVPQDPSLKTKYSGMEFATWFVKETGVQGVPGSFYYGDGNRHHGVNFTRFCYHKSIKTLQTAKQRLTTFMIKLKSQGNAENSGNVENVEKPSGDEKNAEKPGDQENAKKPGDEGNAEKSGDQENAEKPGNEGNVEKPDNQQNAETPSSNQEAGKQSQNQNNAENSGNQANAETPSSNQEAGKQSENQNNAENSGNQENSEQS